MTIHLPTFKVEISFVSPPLSASPFFVDVSADVRLPAGIHVASGRQDAYSQIQASVAAFVLDNATGTYTPNNTTSTYFPNVHRGRAVRITATEDSVTFFPVYYGFIDTLTGTWDDERGLSAGMAVTCVDILKNYARQQITDNIVSLTLLADSPAEYWRLDDPAGTVNPRNDIATGQVQLSTVFLFTSDDSITYGVQGGSPVDGGLTCLQATGDAALRGYATTGYPQLTVEGLFSFNVEAGADPFGVTFSPIVLFDATAANAIVLSVDSGGMPANSQNLLADLEWDTSGSGAIDDTAGQSLNDGQLHHLALTYDGTGSGTAKMYVDGRLAATATAIGSAITFTEFHFAQQTSAPGRFTRTAQHAAVFPAVLSAAQIANHAAAGLSGFAGETSAARLARLAAMYGRTLTVIGTPGTQHMSALKDVKGTFLLDQMNTVMATENGLLYVDPSGQLTLKTRQALYDQAVALTLPSGAYEPDLSFIEDDTDLMNDVTATGDSGNAQEWSDATSISNQGEIGQEFTLSTLDDAEALAFAQWRVGDGKPKTRSPQVSLDLMTQQTENPTLLAHFWQLPLGGLISCQSLPGAAPSSTVNLLAQGISHTLTDQAYDAAIATTPAQIWQAWKLGDAVLGVLDSTTVLGY